MLCLIVSRCDPHGRFTIVYRPDDTGGAAHSCAVGHTTCDKCLTCRARNMSGSQINPSRKKKEGGKDFFADQNKNNPRSC